jgi:hypothetical protein
MPICHVHANFVNITRRCQHLRSGQVPGETVQRDALTFVSLLQILPVLRYGLQASPSRTSHGSSSPRHLLRGCDTIRSYGSFFSFARETSSRSVVILRNGFLLQSGRAKTEHRCFVNLTDLPRHLKFQK